MAYPSQAIGASTSGHGQSTAATGGLLSPEFWGGPGGRVALDARRRERSKRRRDAELSPFTFDFHHAKDPGIELPDQVLWEFTELDNDSRNFLKHGARSAAEKLAYAQQVNPLAHLDAQVAPQKIQHAFQESGALDRSNHFVGPDGRVYLRNEESEESPGAKIRRGFENAIGGFPAHEIGESLRQIPEATRSKRGDVEATNPPTLPEQEARERFLAPFPVNPAAWRSGVRAPENVQQTFRDAPNLWDPYPNSYVGPDGVVYEMTKLTAPDPFAQFHKGREEWERQQFLRTLPPPSDEDLYWRAVESAPVLSRGRFRNAQGPQGKFVPPAGEEARSAIRARLDDIPRLAVLYGRGQLPSLDVVGKPRRYRPPKHLPWGGSRGGKEVQQQHEDIVAFLTKSLNAIHKHGGSTSGVRRQELYIPSPASDFAELFGLKVIDGRLGSNKVDITLQLPNGKLVHIQTGDIDPKTGKVALHELDTALKIYKRTGEMVLVYPKTYQLDRLRRDIEMLKNANQ